MTSPKTAAEHKAGERARTKTSEREDLSTSTVVRATRVLRALADSAGDVSIKDLAGRLGLAPSTVHRLLELLATEGMVERDDATRLYRPGLEFFRIAATVYNRMPVRTIALPFLQAAVEECGEAAYLTLLDRRAGKMIFAASSESPHLLAYRIPLNEPQSLTTGASGLSILAWMPRETGEVDRIIEAESKLESVQSVKSHGQLLSELTQIRQQGYALSFGGRIKGAIGIFAPVFGARDEVIGSLGYTIPELRFNGDVPAKFREAAMRHAAALSVALGGDARTRK